MKYATWNRPGHSTMRSLSCSTYTRLLDCSCIVHAVFVMTIINIIICRTTLTPDSLSPPIQFNVHKLAAYLCRCCCNTSYSSCSIDKNIQLSPCLHCCSCCQLFLEFSFIKKCCIGRKAELAGKNQRSDQSLRLQFCISVVLQLQLHALLME